MRTTEKTLSEQTVTARRPEIVLSARRALIALAIGGAAGAAVGAVGDGSLGPIVGWVAATGVVLTWAWRVMWPLDAAGTQRLAEHEIGTRTTDTEILGGAVASLGAVVFALVRSGDPHEAATTAVVLLSIVGTALSWALVNTVFALKYARLYYVDEDGGVNFKQPTPPAYADFAYLSFTVGMSFAVSETEPTSTAVRRVALVHALLSYVFGTGVLALAINAVTNLTQ